MKIINVFKTHFDIGYTELVSDVVKRYGGKMLEDVLATCEQDENREKNRRFVWTMSAWPLLQALKTCSKDNLERAEKLVREGRLVTHALPFTTHTELMAPYEFDRLFDFAREICDRYSLPFPVSAKMTDVPGHTVALVKPLVQNGVRFLHLGCNPFSLTPDVPLLFWWEDREGNRVLTFYNQTYGSAPVPPADWSYPVWLSMSQTGDNHGAHKPEELDRIFAEIEAKMPDAEILCGTMDDFYHEIIRCDLSGLPVIRGDLGDTWIHGAGTYPKELGMLRRARKKVEALRLPREQTKAFHENALLFYEHTFGLNGTGYMGYHRRYDKEAFREDRKSKTYRLFEKSWDEQRERARFCAAFAARLPQTEPDAADASDARCTENEHWNVFVSNGELHLFDKKNKTTIRPRYVYEVVGIERIIKFLSAYMRNLTCWPVSQFSRPSYWCDDSVFRGKLVDFHEKDGVLLCEYEPEETAPQRLAGDGETAAPKAVDAASVKLYGNCEKVIMEAAVCGEKVWLRVKLIGKQATPYIEGGNLIFETDIPSGRYLVDKSGYVLDCERDIVKNANTKLFAVNEFAQIGHIKIEPVDTPLVSFGDSAVFRFNGGVFEKPEKNNFVFNLFNTMWGTNFPLWIEGDFEFEYFISSENKRDCRAD